MAGTSDRRRDARLAMAVATAWVVVLVLGPFMLRPWGPATPSARDLSAFWTDVPLVTDFVAFWTGATLLREGAGPALYDLEVQRALQLELRHTLATTEELRRFAGAAPYFNPPPLALPFVPLTLLPMSWAFFLWSALSLAAFVVAVALPLRGHPLGRTAAAAMLTYVGVADTLLWGQVNGVLLLAFSLGLLALRAGRPFVGGALLGLLWLKPQLAVLFPLVFLARGRWRELAGMAASGAGIAGLSLALVGPAGVLGFLEILRRIGGYYPPPGTSTAPERMNNWRAVLVHLWPGLPEATGAALVLGLGAATMLAALLAWRGRWEPASPRFSRQMMVTALATLVAAPHSHFHATVMLLAPLALMGHFHSVLSPRFSVLALGYLLALGVWPFRVMYWLLVPYFLVCMGLLIWSCWRTAPTFPLSDMTEKG